MVSGNPRAPPPPSCAFEEFLLGLTAESITVRLLLVLMKRLESKEANGGSSNKEVDETRRIKGTSSKVGTLIGKGGEMVRHLQFKSGAKIQIRTDSEADPNSSL
ncbi:unnamed protein product [Microthlaspi erraticum]|uniref:K Homology domain-containing protein n=1 Tax=Microthlaspi erraticum TaxID=1685480 RepID=A0A6D2JHD1_9BRAS|nr:unnamed protein product [Microthlaspi erraticum]